MTLLIRVVLISLIVFLLIRSFIRYWAEGDNSGQKEEKESTARKTKKGVPKEIGEYVDYEELKKK